jgi:hypothetical protein
MSMFCPQCKTEYRTGFVRCSNCDCELVDRLPPEAADTETHDLGYVVVATVQSPFEEGQISSFLQAHGIPALVRGEGIRKTYGLYINGIGAVQILVPRELETPALDLLAKADRGELEIAADDEPSTRNESEL